jgi:hypothetical protein
MKKILGSLILAGAFLAGCSSDDGGDCTKTTCSAQNATCGSISDGCGGQLSCGTCTGGLTCGTGSSGSVANVCGFAQPAGTVAVDFVVDDTANQKWKNEELEWKGAMLYDTATRKITYDASWAGPWAKLYDDGPWNKGGHEPANATAGDHKLGVTVFATPPATASQAYGYGLRDATNPDTVNGGWLWPPGPDGSFVVNAGATGAITAAGLTFAAYGTTDLKLTIDINDLGAGTWDTSRVAVKGSAWAWSEVDLHDDGTKGDATAGDGIYTFVLSQYPSTSPPYYGLLKSGDRPEFIFVLGPSGGSKEYKDSNAVAEKTGVTAGTKASGAADFTNQPLQITGGTGLGSGNTFIEVP